jgi:hypothetical protein
LPSAEEFKRSLTEEGKYLPWIIIS